MLTEFKMFEEIKGVNTQIIHLSRAVENANLQLKDLNVGIRTSSRSANKSTWAMISLTVALVLFTLAQVVIAWLTYKADQEIVGVKRNCYQSVLQTPDINLNYKNCLRNHGLSNE